MRSLLVAVNLVNLVYIVRKKFTIWMFLRSKSFRSDAIPFLEHDDADRALMGAKDMQRQAVPTLHVQINRWWVPEWKNRWHWTLVSQW